MFVTWEEPAFASVLWLLVGAFVLHETEEWNITAFERRHFVGLPPQVTEENGRAWLMTTSHVARRGPPVSAWMCAKYFGPKPSRANA